MSASSDNEWGIVMEDCAGLSSGAVADQLSDKQNSTYSQPFYYQAATSLAHVEVAWGLVYERYVQTGLIAPNPFGLHTCVHAVQPNTCVVLGQCADRTESTLSLISDGDRGLSLDSVYPRELDALRAGGRRLLEVGLLADRSSGLNRGMSALFEMMKWAAYYSLHRQLSDIVIGVHPRHVKFYSRCFAFEQFGPQSVYPLVKNKPVVPLRLRLNEQLAQPRLPRGLRYVRDNPVDFSAFSDRYKFCGETLKDSAIERFMKFQRQQETKPISRSVYTLSDTFKGVLSASASMLAQIRPAG